MTSGNAGWQFLDIEAGSLPEEVLPSRLPDGGGGRIVVLAATPNARVGEWAGRAVVAIARGWAEAGLRIFLMDLGLERPSLHEALALANEDGVSDAFLYGASVQHIARPALDDTIFFAPAGTATADPEEVLGHPRWDDLTGGFSEADATLLLFLPTDTPGAEGILGRATDVLFLSREDESPDEHLGPASVKVFAGVGPRDAGQAEAGEWATEGIMMAGGLEGDLGPLEVDLPMEEGAGDALGLELLDDFELSEGFAGIASEAETDLPGEESEPFGVVESPGEEAVPEGAALEGAGDTAIDIPDFGADFAEIPSLEDDAPGPGPVPETGTVEGLVQGPDFGQSQAVDMDRTLVPGREDEPPSDAPPSREATQRPSALERPRPSPPPKKVFTRGRISALVGLLAVLGLLAIAAFDLFPVPGLSFIQGYFVQVPTPSLNRSGPASTDPPLHFSVVLDSGFMEEDLPLAVRQLDAWRERFPDLLFTLVPTGPEGMITYTVLAGPAVDRTQAEALRATFSEVRPEDWQIRETPLGFHLGFWPTPAEAEAQVSTLEAEGLFGYALQVSLTDGTEGYDVFAGAFEGVGDAGALWQKLLGIGLSDAPLIQRRGRLLE